MEVISTLTIEPGFGKLLKSWTKLLNSITSGSVGIPGSEVSAKSDISQEGPIRVQLRILIRAPNERAQ
jgi:hypothetical protein